MENIIFCHDPENPGVGKAYNEALKVAEKLGKKWMLLCDQDTLFPPDALTAYQKSLQQYPECKLMIPTVSDNHGLLSPFRFKGGVGFRMNKVSPGSLSLSGVHFINSGLWISVSLFKATGGYDEKLKLDFSDIVFQEKVRRQLNECVVAPVSCRHHLSSDSKDEEAAKNRFDIYCQSFLYAKKNIGTISFFKLVLAIRGLRLSFRFKTLHFLLAGIKYSLQ